MKLRAQKYLRSFLDDFLDVILAEAAMAGVVDLPEDGGRLRLANRHHSDIVGAAAGLLGRQLDAVEN